MLEDFQTGTASMARKRHLASTARGFCGFCLTPATELIRPIRPIRGKKSSGVLPSRQRLGVGLSIPRALPPVTHSSAFQAPERMLVLVM